MPNALKRLVVVVAVLLLSISFVSAPSAQAASHAQASSASAQASWSYWVVLGPSSDTLQWWDFCPVFHGRKVVASGLGKYHLSFYVNDSSCTVKAFDHDGGHGIGYTLPKTKGYKTLPAQLQHGRLHSIVVYR